MPITPFDTQADFEYIPQPFEDISKFTLAQQGELDKSRANLKDLAEKALVQGGPRTQDRAKAFNQNIMDSVNSIANDINNNKDIKGAAKKMQDLRMNILANPEYQDIKLDEQSGWKHMEKVANPDFSYHVQNFFDPKSKQTIQTKPGERFNDTWYASIAPGNTNAEYKPIFDQIKPQISRYYNDPSYESYIDELGNVHTRSIETGKEVETLTRDQVRNTIANYIKNDPNALNKQSIFYNRALHEKQFPGSKYDANDALEDIANAFLGEFETRKDIQKIGGDKVTKPGGSGSGSGGGTKPPFEHSNRFGDIQKSLISTGTAKLNTKDIAAAYNGVDNKDGSVTFANTGETFIHVNKNNSPEAYNEDIKVNKAVQIKAKEEAVKKAIAVETGAFIQGNIPNSFNEASSLPADGSSPFVIVNENVNKDAPNRYSYIYREGVTYYMQTGFKKEKLGDNISLKNTKFYTDLYKKTLESNQEYTDLQESKEALGFDYNDPKMQEKLKSFTTNKILEDFNLALSNFAGDITVRPGTGKDAFTDSEGNVFNTMYALFTEEDLEALIPSSFIGTSGWEKLKEDKLIKETKRRIKNSNGEWTNQTVYEIPIIKQIEDDVSNLTSSMQTANWGDAEWVNKNLPAMQEENEIRARQMKAANMQNTFYSNYDKNPDFVKNWDLKLNRLMKNLELDDPEMATAVNAAKLAIMELPEKTQVDKNIKKEKLFMLHLKIYQPDLYNSLDVGKRVPQGQGSNPLGIK